MPPQGLKLQCLYWCSNQKALEVDALDNRSIWWYIRMCIIYTFTSSKNIIFTELANTTLYSSKTLIFLHLSNDFVGSKKWCQDITMYNTMMVVSHALYTWPTACVCVPATMYTFVVMLNIHGILQANASVLSYTSQNLCVQALLRS